MIPSLESLVKDASGETGPRQTRAAARLMSLLEKHPQRLPEIFQILPRDEWPQPRLLLGITGAPGSGKSSLTDAIIAEQRTRYPDRRIGVIAVDPSSPFTGGAVLGDRVRMMRHATDPMIFIRSLATRGHLGGLSLGVKGVMRAMGLIGCDTVILETVGVGQSEIEIATVADLVLIVLAPGQGDSIQMLKAGLMEVGDLFVVNKADREGANQLFSTLLSTLDLAQNGAAQASTMTHADLGNPLLMRERLQPDVLLASATEGAGIPELLDRLEERVGDEHSSWTARREARVAEDVREALLEEARLRLDERIESADIDSILSGDKAVDRLTRELLARAAETTLAS